MERFTTLTAVAAPILRDNIDTDAIIPSREMKGTGKTGLADGLFAGWRYTVIGGREPDPAFVLNQSDYAGARILLTGANVGCGSSREHAAWALAEFGVRAIIAPSFNPIFLGNCVRNGIVPVVLSAEAVTTLADAIAPDPKALLLTVDLPAQQVINPSGLACQFNIAQEAKDMLLHGLDAIDLTLQRRATIEAFVAADRVSRSWASSPVERGA
jgi:3-isopropylmalate/(R)-2-methylmalate dehydratase small subunit